MKYGLAAFQPPAKKCDFGESVQISQRVADRRFIACGELSATTRIERIQMAPHRLFLGEAAGRISGSYVAQEADGDADQAARAEASRQAIPGLPHETFELAVLIVAAMPPRNAYGDLYRRVVWLFTGEHNDEHRTL